MSFDMEMQRTFKQYRKVVTADYTVRTGRAADKFVADLVVDVVDPADDVAITLSDAEYIGQTCLITLSSNASSKTVTVTAATGSGGDSTMATAGMYMDLVWVNSTDGWAARAESVTS